MSAFFVTGAGTEIGKTFYVARRIADGRAAGESVRALKPVISGFDPENADATDTGRLLTAMGRPTSDEDIASISPWRYIAPMSPDMAAAREGRDVPVDEIVAFCRSEIDAASASGETLLIEGIGGVMVPLDGTRTVLDLISALSVPAILVGGSYLGALSHTLTALAALQNRRIPVERIVISETPGSGIPLSETRDTVARLAAPVPVETLVFEV